MIFKPPFQLPPYSGQDDGALSKIVQPPPIARVDVILGSDWDNSLPGDPSKAAQEIINHYAGRLMQFFRAQQHNYNLGVAEYSGTVMEEPRLVARYSANQGTDMLYLEIRPSNITPVSGNQINIGGVFTVTVDFGDYPTIGRPIFGLADTLGNSQGSQYSVTPADWGFYVWDAQFYDPVLRSSSLYASSPDPNAPQSLYASTVPTYSSYSPLDGTDGDTADDPSANLGFDSAWWLRNVGGSGICITPIEGMAYWEVEIVTLPSGVPSTLEGTAVLPAPDAGKVTTTATHISEETDVSYIDLKGSYYTFPEDLTTFLTPTIGIVPGYYVDPSWKKDTVIAGRIVGCDFLAPVETKDIDGNVILTTYFPRSISVSPTSNRYTDFKYTTWTNAAYTINDPTYNISVPTGLGTLHQQTGDLVYVNASSQIIGKPTTVKGPPGPSALVTSFAMWEDQYPAFVTEAEQTKIVTLDGQLVGINGTEVFLINAGKIDWSTQYFPTSPLISAFNFQSMHEIIEQPNYWSASYNIDYAYLGVVGQVVNLEVIVPGSTQYEGQYVYAIWGTLAYTPGYKTDYTVENYYIIGDVFLGPDFTYDLHCAAGGPGYTPPTGINKLGSHAWLIKGRGDMLALTTVAASDLPVDTYNTTGAQKTLRNGVWTGVDLQSLEEGDVVMVAVDTGTRGVWFGKNKMWYDANGPTLAKPGDKGFTPNTYLDGDGKTLYYPAVSARWGKTVMKLRYGPAVKYPPPNGFKPYNVVTINTA